MLRELTKRLRPLGCQQPPLRKPCGHPLPSAPFDDHCAACDIACFVESEAEAVAAAGVAVVRLVFFSP